MPDPLRQPIEVQKFPPPPPPPEPFPGFGGLVKTVTRDYRAANKRMEEAEAALVAHGHLGWTYKLPKPSRSVTEWIAAGRPGSFSDFAGELVPAQEAWERDKERLLAERQDAVRQLGRASWFKDFYDAAPNLVMIGAVGTLEDYLKLMKSDPTGILSDADLQTARDTLFQMTGQQPATPREDAPDWLKMTPEDEEAVRVAFALEPAPPETIHRITVNQLLKSLTRQPEMDMPEEWTMEQLLQFASIMDIPESEITRVVDYTELLEPYARAISEREEQIKAVLAGEEEWQMPELGFGQKLMFTLLSPMQVAADVIRPYLETVSYPIAGSVAYQVSRFLAGTQEIEDQYAKMKALGYSPWQAMSEAYQEWSLPWYYKLALEIFTDPITYSPGLLLSIPGKILIKTPTAATRALGSGMLALNRGLWSVLDVPFDTFKAFWAHMPKTFNQATKFELNSFRDLLVAASTKQSGHIVTMLTPDDLAQTLTRALKDFSATPMKQGDVFVDLGAELIRHAPLDEKSVQIWSRSLGGKLDDVTPTILESVEDVVGDAILHLGSPAEDAKRIAIALGVDDTPTVIGKIVKDIGVITNKYAVRVPRAIEIGKRAKINPTLQMTEYLVSGQKKIIQAVERSAYAKGKAFSGTILALMNKVDVLERGVFRLTLDRWLVRPMAEAYLGSVAYPIWNAFEGIFVSALEGVVPRMAKQEAFQRMFTGVRGVDSRVMQWSASDVAGMLGTMPGREGAVSILPGKVPEKALGLRTPKWISGKDWFEWTGRKWIELSDVWGTGFRANFLMRKMASYLAEYSYKVSGQDLNAAFRKLIGKPPGVGKKSIGLTEHELKQEMFARLTSGMKAEVLGMKELLSNSSLMQGEALKILRQATELSPQAKTLGEQMIARGEAFSGRLPLRAKVLDWDTVDFTNVGEHFTGQIKTLVDELPAEIRLNVRTIRFDARLKLTAAKWNPRTKTVIVQSPEHIKHIPHELGHSVSNEALDEGSWILLRRFAGDSEIDDIYQRFAHLKNTMGSDDPRRGLSTYELLYGHVRGFREVEESFAKGFSDFVTLSSSAFKAKHGGAVLDFFGSQFPKRGNGLESIDNFCKTIADQSVADLRAFPSQAPEAFRFIADQIETVAQKEINTADDLMQVFQHFEVMSDTASKVPTKLLSQTFEEADELKRLGKFGQLEELWRTSRIEVEGVVDSIGDSLSRARAVIEAKSVLLTEKQQGALLALLERNTARLQLQEQFLRFDGRLLDDFWALPKAVRTKEEHTALRAYRQENILNYKGEDAVLGAGDFLERKSYSQLYHNLPKPKLFHVDATARALSADDCAKAMNCNVDALTTGMMESMTFQDKPYFIQMIKQSADANPTVFKGFTEDKIGAVYDDIIRGLRMSPEADIATQKILQQVEGVKQRMIALRMNKSLSPAEETALHGWIDNVAGGMDDIVGKKGKVTTEAWGDIRQRASDSAHREYYKAFADYTNENIIDAMGKSIYPFWTYHLYRWFFLPRTFIRKPGTMAAWGKYYEYSDYGYQHIPGTDIEFNPAVGSAFGATFSLARHDFKSYYENLGFAGEVLDYTQRRGFFPGIHVTLPIALTSVFSDRPPELGEVLPPLHRVGLNLLVNSGIPIVADAAKWLKDRVFHENFHDYYTATVVSAKQSDAGGKLVDGQSGVDLWFKIQRGEKLTEDEQLLWDEAYEEAAWIAILRSEFPEFRLRAEEMLEAHKQVTTLIEAQTGMDSDMQDNLWKHNLRPTDVIGGLPLDLRMALDQMWQWRIYFGRGSILMPPEYSDLYNLMDKYHDRVESYQLERLALQTDTNKGFLQPTKALHFNGGEWRREYANNWSAYVTRVESIEADPEFADAIEAMTPEGQVRLAQELGFTPPPTDPMREAIRLYFEIELEKKTDEFTGEEDFDYLRFWLEREAVRMTLPEEQRGDFDAYIRRYQTPMEVLFKQITSTYLRGFRAVSRIVLEEFTDEEKALIAEFYADTTSRERKLEIKDFESHSGRKLISYWDSRRTDVREALRRESPVLDFWLYVFGYVTSPKTDEAKAMVDAWEKDRTGIVRGITESPKLLEVMPKVETKKEELSKE